MSFMNDNYLLENKDVFLEKDFSFVEEVLTFLKNYDLDGKAVLVGSARKNYIQGNGKNYNDIDVLIGWNIYNDKNADNCIENLHTDNYPRGWYVEAIHSSEYTSGYGGVTKVKDRFKIHKEDKTLIDLIFEAERSHMEEAEMSRLGHPLKPLRN